MVSEEKLHIVRSDDGVIFAVHVQPRAARTEICGLHGQEIKLRLTSPPVDDAANILCIEFLAKSLGVAKSRVTIVHGLKSRHKKIAVTGVAPADILKLL